MGRNQRAGFDFVFFFYPGWSIDYHCRLNSEPEQPSPILGKVVSPGVAVPAQLFHCQPGECRQRRLISLAICHTSMIVWRGLSERLHYH